MFLLQFWIDEIDIFHKDSIFLCFNMIICLMVQVLKFSNSILNAILTLQLVLY